MDNQETNPISEGQEALNLLDEILEGFTEQKSRETPEKLSHEDIEFISKKYRKYVNLVEGIARNFFLLKNPEQKDAEVLTFEINGTSVIATITCDSQNPDTEQLCSVIFPTSYLTNKDWKKEAKKEIDELKERMGSYGSEW